LGKIFVQGPFNFFKKAFKSVYDYVTKQWLDFYKSARSFNPKKFISNFGGKAFNGIKKMISKVKDAVSGIMNGIRAVIGVFKKGFKKSELQVGSIEASRMLDGIVRDAIQEHKEHEEQVGEIGVSGYQHYKWGGVLSVDFGVAVSAIIQFAYGGGLFACYGFGGCSMKSDYGSWVGMGIGVKADISVGVGANVFLWNSASSIPGWAGTFAIGADMSPSECGVDLALVHSMAPAYVTALGFSVGCGAGLMPIDIQWMAGYSWANFPACGRYGEEAENALSSSESDSDFDEEFEDAMMNSEFELAAEDDDGFPAEYSDESEFEISEMTPRESYSTVGASSEYSVSRRYRRCRRRRCRRRSRRRRRRRSSRRRRRRRRRRSSRRRRSRNRRRTYRKPNKPASCPKVAAAMEMQAQVGYTEAEMMY